MKRGTKKKNQEVIKMAMELSDRVNAIDDDDNKLVFVMIVATPEAIHDGNNVVAHANGYTDHIGEIIAEWLMRRPDIGICVSEYLGRVKESVIANKGATH